MLKKFKLQVTSLAIALTMLAGGVTVMADEEKPEFSPISAGTTVTVEETKYYTFTPEEDGLYLFDSSAIEDGPDEGDPLMYIYLSSDIDNSIIYACLDDDNEGHCFSGLVRLKAGKEYFLWVGFYNSEEIGTCSYNFTIKSYAGYGFTDKETFDFMLVDPNSKLSINFPQYKVPDDELFSDVKEYAYSFPAKSKLSDSVISFDDGAAENTWVGIGLEGLYDTKLINIFVMEDEPEVLESGKTISINNTFEYTELDDEDSIGEDDDEEELAIEPGSWYTGELQGLYSFTPEKNGTAKISITNMKSGLPMIALFDQDYNLIKKEVGCDIDDMYMYLGYEEGMVEGNIPQSLDTDGEEEEDVEVEPEDTKEDVKPVSYEDICIEATLEGGKTYYVAIPFYIVEAVKLDTVLDLTLDFEEEKEEEKNDDDNNNNNNNNGNENGNGNEDSNKDEKNVEAFVKRLYEEVFGRDADEGGLKYWVDRINNGATGADVVKEFLASPEFDGKKLNDEDFVIKLYSIFFGRVPGKDEIKFWVDSLKTDSRDTVVNNFINTTEWDEFCKSYGVKSGARFPINDPSNILDFAKRLYTCCLERDPDESGLNFWNDALVNHKMTGTQVAKEFFWSAEFMSFKTSDAEFITRLYRTMMGREPEPEGFAFWMNDIKVESREQVFMGFAQSPEFKSVCEKCGISWM